MSEPAKTTKTPAGLTLEVLIDGVARAALLHRDTASGALVAQVEGRTVPVDAYEIAPGILSLLIAGRAYRCVLMGAGEERAVALRGGVYRVAVVDPRSLRAQRRAAGAGNGAMQVKASMPGRVARVLVSAGDDVEAQQGILVIEAMKMQNELKTMRAGRVAEIRVAAGDTVTSGQVLAVLE
jgi:biotin carboxyl carrier protein